MPKELLNKQDIDRVLARMAHEILERNKGTGNLCLVGIQRGGVVGLPVSSANQCLP